MRIYTSDKVKNVDIGTDALWLAVYSTAIVRLSEDDRDFLDFAMDFLKSGQCVADDAQITARQLELVRRRFGKIISADAVGDFQHPQKGISCPKQLKKNAVSCADLFTTADNKDFFDEIIGLLKYADEAKVDTLIE
jgi:hypothetical protein